MLLKTRAERDRVVSSVSEKGRRMFSDLSTALEPNQEEDREGEARAERERQRTGSRASTESGRGSQQGSTRPPSQASLHE